MDPNAPSPSHWLANASRTRQWLLIGTSVLVLFVLLGAAYFTLRPRYQVLFSDLRPQDASSVVAELDKQKVPYRLDGHGDTTTVLVPGEAVRATRIKVMSGDLKLKNVVGMELFNNSDLGLTDFTQKVNYQRALQGELARTIMSLDEVDTARVHLTMPESSIFRNDQDHPKASVALFLRDEQPLAADTVRGIQRLVAAAVPQMRPADVAVVDARGTPVSGTDYDIDDPKFALKQSVEHYYQRKILDQLSPLLRDNHASVSVNADINFDQVSLTRESDTAASPDANVATLVPPLPTNDKSGRKISLPPLPPGGLALAAQKKTQRTLEQVVSAPGSIKRLSVGIVLDRVLAADDSKSLQALIAATIGMDTARGDVYSVAVRSPQPAAVQPPTQSEAASEDTLPSPDAQHRDSPSVASPLRDPMAPVGVLIAALLCGGVGIGLLLRLVWPRRKQSARLTEDERKMLAQRLQRLLSEPEQTHARS